MPNTSNMPNTLKAFLFALGLLFGSAVLALVGAFTLALLSGSTMSGGERAVMLAGAFDLLMAAGTVVTFSLLTRSMPVFPRIVAVVFFAVLECLVLGMLFIFTLVMLNR